MWCFTDKDNLQDASFEIAPTVRCGGKNGGGVRLAIAFTTQQEPKVNKDGKAFAITADSSTGGGQRQCVAVNKRVTGTLASSGAGSERPAGNCNETDMLVVEPEYAVRRLTVTECERLQAFPDGWTDIPYRGKPAKDGPRYRALGNSKCAAVVRQIGERIDFVDKLLKQQESEDAA